MANFFDQFDAPSSSGNFFDQFDEKPAAPPPKKPGIIRSLADVALEVPAGAAGATKAIADAFGAGNALSQGLDSFSKGAYDLQSDARQAERQQQAQRMVDAEKTGSAWEEVKAAGQNFLESPVSATAQAVGSLVPTVAAALASKRFGLPVGQVAGTVGGVQGAGAVKGSIYDDQVQRGIAAGLTPEQAQAKAEAAQSYAGGNLDQIAVGTGLGVLAGTTGVEKVLGGGASAIKSRLGRTAMGAVQEAIPEAAQGGQERLAANIAAQREGYDASTWGGVAGQATLEGLASTGPGAVGGAMSRYADPNAGPLSRAAATAEASGASAAVAPDAVQAQDVQADPYADRMAQVASMVEDRELLRALRGDGRFGKESVTELLGAWAVARNPQTDPALRERALAGIEQFLSPLVGPGVFGGQQNFTMPQQEPDAFVRDPQTGLVPSGSQAVTAPAQSPFDPNTLDGQAREVGTLPRTMLDGPEDAAQQYRRELLESVLSDPDTRNPLSRYESVLKKNGFEQRRATPEERKLIEDRTKPAEPERAALPPFAAVDRAIMESGITPDNSRRPAFPMTQEGAQRRAAEQTQASGQAFEAVPHPTVAGRFTVQPVAAANTSPERVTETPEIEQVAPADQNPIKNESSAVAGVQAEPGEIGAQQSRIEPTNSLSRTASWVLRNKETGEVVMETFDRKKVDALNTDKYEAVPIQEHLASLNRQPTNALLNSGEIGTQGDPVRGTETPEALPPTQERGTAQQAETVAEQVRDASPRETAVADRAEPVLDLNKRPTGWKQVDYPNGDGVLLISADGKKAINFPSRNAKSGTESLRAQAKAQAFAIDNPHASNAPQGELVVQPIFEKQAQQAEVTNAAGSEQAVSDIAAARSPVGADSAVTGSAGVHADSGRGRPQGAQEGAQEPGQGVAAKAPKPGLVVAVDAKDATKRLRRYFAATTEDQGPHVTVQEYGKEARIEVLGRSHTNYSKARMDVRLTDGKWEVSPLHEAPTNEIEREYQDAIRSAVEWLNTTAKSAKAKREAAPVEAEQPRSDLDTVAERVTEPTADKWGSIDTEADAPKREGMLRWVAIRSRSDEDLNGVLDRLPDPMTQDPYVGETSRIAHSVMNNPAASDKTKERAKKIYDGATRGISAEPTHADPGEAPEAATAPVIREAIQKSARNTEFNAKEAKAWLLAEIDRAIADAPADGVMEGVTITGPVTNRSKKEWTATRDIDVQGTTLSARLAIRQADGGFVVGERFGTTVYARSPNLELASEDAARLLHSAEWKTGTKANGAFVFDTKALEQKEFVTFDVPGDGTFRVVNAPRNLQAFRDKVETSPGFRANPVVKPNFGTGSAQGPSLDETLKQLGNTPDALQEIGNAIEIARLKKAKDEDKLLDRFREASNGKDYDAWRAEQDAEGEIATREAGQSATPNSPEPRAEQGQQADTGADKIKRSFAGESARTADTHALATAQSRIAAGEDAETVRQETGWHKSVDGKWRFEIDDSEATLKQKFWTLRLAAMQGDENKSYALATVLDHPKLFAAYPFLRETRVFGEANKSRGGAYFADGDGLGNIAINLENMHDPDQAMSVLLHEIQHAIQDWEGFAAGGSVRSLMPENSKEILARRQKLLDEITRIQDEGGDASALWDRLDAMEENPVITAEDRYRRLAGETEARNTQARQKLTAAERRATSPEATADVKASDVIVVFNGTEMASAPAPANAAPMESTGTTTEAIWSAVESLVGPFRKGRIIIVQSADELVEQGVIHSRDAQGAQAFVKDGKAYFIADAIRPGNERAVFLHEVGAHLGMESILSPLQRSVLTTRIKTWAAQNNGTIESRIAQAAQRRVEAAGATGKDADTELVAYFVEEAVKAGINPTTQTKGPIGEWFRILWSAMTKALQKLGLVNPAKLTAQDVVDLAHGAANVVMESDAQAGGAQFSRDQTRTEDPNDARIQFSKASDMAASAFDRAASALPKKAGDYLRYLLDGDTAKTFNWYHKTVGTQAHKAKIDPEHYGKVFKIAQSFIDDVSRFGVESADLAPNLLPKMDTTAAAIRGARHAFRDKADAKAISAPIFEGTLYEENGVVVGKVWEDHELRERFQLNDRQINLYREFRAAVDHSLEVLAVAEMTKVARAYAEPKNPGDLALIPPSRDLSMSELAKHYTEQFDADLKDARQQLSKLRSEIERSNAQLLENAGVLGKSRQEFHAVMLKKEAADNAKVEALEKKISELGRLKQAFAGKAETIRSLQQAGYAPLMRFGEYTVDVVQMRDALDENGAPIIDPQTGEVKQEEFRPFFGMFESQRKANEAAKIMREEYPDATVTTGIGSQDGYQLFGAVSMDSLEMLARLAGKEEDAFVQKFYKEAVSQRSALKRLIHRKGTAGYSDDVTRSLAAFLMSNARATASSYHFGDLMNAAANIPKEKGDVKDEAVRLINYIRDPNEEAGTLRGILFMHYLGGSVAAAAVNLTQSVTTTAPFLHQFGVSALDIVKAGAMAARRMRGKAGPGFSASLRAALTQAEDEGVVAQHNVHALMGQAGTQAFMNNRGWRLFSQLWGSFFGMAEQFNRETAFIAAFQAAEKMGRKGLAEAYGKAADLAAKRGLPAPDRETFSSPYAFAKDAVQQTQFILSKAGRPNWARGTVGSLLMTFKQFQINYVELFKRLPNKERAIMLGTLVVLAGAGGLPGADDLDDLIDTLGQSLGYNTNAKRWKEEAARAAFGQTGGNFVRHGVTAFLPIELASRLGMGNMFPSTGLLKASSENYSSREAFEALGPFGGYLQSLKNGYDYFQRGRYVQAFTEAALPKAAKDIAKGLEMAGSGVYDDTKGRRVVDVDGIDAFVKALGFQPTAVSMVQRTRGVHMQDVALFKAVKANIAEMFAQGVYQNDPELRAKANALREEWNEKNPDQKMAPPAFAGIRQRVKAMRDTAAGRMEKTTPRELRRSLMEMED